MFCEGYIKIILYLSFSDIRNYRITTPAEIPFPGPHFCDEKQEFLIFGRVDKKKTSKTVQIYFGSDAEDKAFYIDIDVSKTLISSWVLVNGTRKTSKKESSFIEYGQPFEIR